MSVHSQVLVIDDDRYDNDRYCQVLRSAGYTVEATIDPEYALHLINEQEFNVIILDMLLPLRLNGQLEFGGIELLKRIKQRNSMTQVIAVTGYGSRELAVEAMAAGALDYITKDPDTDDRLPGSVRVAMARIQDLREPHPNSIDDTDDPVQLTTPSHLVADSTIMRQLLRRTQRLASIDSPVLIVGEPGVGKQLFATVLHINSHYASGPCVVVPCRNLSKNSVELWGEVVSPSSGFCVQAAGGTLVLKDIEELSFNQQKALVNLVAHKLYQPIGAKELVSCNFRVIATTSNDLERLTRQGRFWRGLYDALSVASLDVPPLRERRDKDDLMAITGYLLHQYGLATGVSPEVTEILSSYDYTKGNIRELEEILKFAGQKANFGIIEVQHLPASFHTTLTSNNVTPYSQITTTPDNDSIFLTIRFIPGDPAILLWESPSGGSSRSHLSLPFLEADLPIVLKVLDAVQWPSYPLVGPQFEKAEQEKLTQLGLRQKEEIASDVARIIGQLLYRAVIADPVAQIALENVRNLATTNGKSLSIILRFPPDAITLAALPWELLWDERQPLLLSRGKLSSCIRYIDLSQPSPPTVIYNRKLHVLAVCPVSGFPETLRSEERLAREEAFRQLKDKELLVMEDLPVANIGALIDRLQDGEPIDIFHFYGHGVWKNGIAHLQFEDGLLDVSQLAALLSDIPLVMLHACRTATVELDNLFTSIAPMLSAEGVRAVVAMQFTVSAKAANRFSLVMYRNLAKGASLQAAVAKARQALYGEYKNSWYVPSIYIRSREYETMIFVKD